MRHRCKQEGMGEGGDLCESVGTGWRGAAAAVVARCHFLCVEARGTYCANLLPGRAHALITLTDKIQYKERTADEQAFITEKVGLDSSAADSP